MATRVIGAVRVPDYVSHGLWPTSFRISHQAGGAPMRLSDVDIWLRRIDSELEEVGRVRSRFASRVTDAENAALFLEPAEGSVYDDIDTWEMSVVSITEVDHEHILEYRGDDNGLWR
jgi:hypothetical protein